MQTTNRYMSAARHCARVTIGVLQKRQLTPAFSQFALIETPRAVWMIATLDLDQIEKIEQYKQASVLHQISTELQGLPVLLSNHTGLRYAVLLSKPAKLKKLVAFPDEYDKHTLPLGITRTHQIHLAPQHLRNALIAGATRSGKSNLLLQMAYTSWIAGHKIALADPQLNTFNELWETLSFGQVASTNEELISLLRKVQGEAMKRLDQIHACQTANGLPATKIEEYNENTPIPMPRLFVFIDEANTFLGPGEVQQSLTDIARSGLKVGIHMIMAAHSWRAADIPRGLSASFETRITFRVNDKTSANVVMDNNIGDRAMKIRYAGRGLIRYNGRPMTDFQAYLMPEIAIANLLKSAGATKPKSFIPDNERELMEKALQDQDGKLTIAELEAMGLQYREARRMLDQWALKGWVVKDPQKNNARVLSDEIRLVLASG